MILIIDNYDSFVYNLARYFERAGWDFKVIRNDAVTLKDITNLRPEALVLSPGPCTPKEAGICIEAVRHFGQHLPILGVCLGHQCIAEAYGDETLHARTPVHGKDCEIDHDGKNLFQDLPSPMTVGRYHSLITKLKDDSPLCITATYSHKSIHDGADEIMAFEHQTHPVYGVQFHPESILTPHGFKLIENFTDIVLAWNKGKKKAA